MSMKGVLLELAIMAFSATTALAIDLARECHTVHWMERLSRFARGTLALRMGARAGEAGWQWAVADTLVDRLPVLLVCLFFYWLISRVVDTARRRDSLCRRCHAVLRTLQTPECPACGERI